MKLEKNRIHLFILLFAVSSLLVHVPSDAYAAADTWTDATTTNVGTTHMRGVSMGDASNGVAVGNSGQIVYTSDGGDTWTAATTTNVGATNMYGVSMGDANNGVAVGQSGQIAYTTNGGVDWTGSTQDVSELAEILGIADEQLPPWVANLALWVSEDRISMGDMIVSIEHLINN